MKPTARLLRGATFVDTSAFYALADRTDRLHSAAIRFLESNTSLLVTSNLVVQETITLLRMRLGHDAAVNFWATTLCRRSDSDPAGDSQGRTHRLGPLSTIPGQTIQFY